MTTLKDSLRDLRRATRAGALPLLYLLLPLQACSGEDLDQAGADALFEKLRAAEYRQWRRAPGYETPQPTIRAHGETAEIFVNTTLSTALDSEGLSEWPDGSLIVKDSFNGSDLSLIAAMEKRSGSFYYAEWNAAGEAKYAGRPDVCVNCHSAGNDELLAVALP